VRFIKASLTVDGKKRSDSSDEETPDLWSDLLHDKEEDHWMPVSGL